MTTQIDLFKRLINPAVEMDWEVVYAEYLPKVYNFFRYRLGDDNLAEDLTATTFEKAWTHRQKYRHNLGAFSTWLFRIARNVAIDHFRQQKHEVNIDHAAQLSDRSLLERQYQQQSDRLHLAQLLAQLSERERELVALKYGAGLTNRAIAKQTGLSESNVGTILSRTVHKLRAGWEEKS